jgi:hypothetical protein
MDDCEEAEERRDVPTSATASTDSAVFQTPASKTTERTVHHADPVIEQQVPSASHQNSDDQNKQNRKEYNKQHKGNDEIIEEAGADTNTDTWVDAMESEERATTRSPEAKDGWITFSLRNGRRRQSRSTSPLDPTRGRSHSRTRVTAPVKHQRLN